MLSLNNLQTSLSLCCTALDQKKYKIYETITTYEFLSILKFNLYGSTGLMFGNENIDLTWGIKGCWLWSEIIKTIKIVNNVGK